MSKRSAAYKRRKRDAYDTPLPAVAPLARHLPESFTFVEPCAGRGLLLDHLVGFGGSVAAAYDVAPRRADIAKKDARDLTVANLKDADFIITNTPWRRALLHDLIVRFSDLRPTWLLLDSDWVHTKQAIPYLARLRVIQSIGRVKWIAGTKSTGYDNACWHLFDKPSRRRTVFYGRAS